MQKILHISKYYYPYRGGTETVCQDIAEGLVAFENRVICFNDGRKTQTDIVNGIPVLRVGCQLQLASQSIAFGYYRQLKR